MSITLPIVDLSAATTNTTGVVSWVTAAGAIQSQATNDNAATIWIFNESPCGLQLTFQTGEQPFLPAGGWVDMTLQPNCTQYSYNVVYVMTGPLVTSLITVWFAPGENVPRIPLLGNSPIGGSIVSNSIAQFLQGANQGYSLTEVDVIATGPMLQPSGNSQGLTLASTNGSGVGQGMIFLSASSNHITFNRNTDYFFGSHITTYNNENTVAAGVPYIVAFVQDMTVTSTASQTVLTYSVPGGGPNALLRVGAYVQVANGTSSNNITFSVAYTNSNGNARTVFLSMQAASVASTSIIFTGSNAASNATYTGGLPLIAVLAGTTVTVTYRDPTNTPNDTLSATIERLA